MLDPGFRIAGSEAKPISLADPQQARSATPRQSDAVELPLLESGYLGGLAATVSFVEGPSKITNFGDVKVCGIWMYANGVWFRLVQVAQNMLFLSFKFFQAFC